MYNCFGLTLKRHKFAATSVFFKNINDCFSIFKKKINKILNAILNLTNELC